MKIMDRVRHVGQEVGKDSNVGGPLGKMLHDASINAVLGGIKSDAWKIYMSLFADSEEQLARLRGQDTFSEEQGWVTTSLAYLAGNGTCGGMTPEHLPENVNDDIDFGIENISPSDAVMNLRPFQVPEPPAQPDNQPQPGDQPT